MYAGPTYSIASRLNPEAPALVVFEMPREKPAPHAAAHGSRLHAGTTGAEAGEPERGASAGATVSLPAFPAPADGITSSVALFTRPDGRRHPAVGGPDRHRDDLPALIDPPESSAMRDPPGWNSSLA